MAIDWGSLGKSYSRSTKDDDDSSTSSSARSTSSRKSKSGGINWSSLASNYAKQAKQLEEDAEMQQTPKVDTGKQAPQPKKGPGFWERLVKGVGDFTAASNEALLGGAVKGGANLVNSLLTGFNQKETEKRTSDFMRKAVQVNERGESLLSEGASRENTAFKAGAITGEGQKLLAELALMAVPGAAAEKAVRGTGSVAKLLQSGNKATKLAGRAAPIAAGSAAATGVGAVQDIANNEEQNLAKNALLGTTIDLAAPVVGKVALRGLGRLKGKSLTEATSKMGVSSLKPKSMEPKVAGLDVEAPARSIAVDLADLTKTSGPKRLAGGKKERGFIETLRTSERTAPELKTDLEKKAGYTPQPNDPLVKGAFKLVGEDINKAEQVAKESSNKGVATATALIDHYQKAGNFTRAGEVAEEAAKLLTEAGRTVQMASVWNRLSPEGIVQYASRQLSKSGKKLDPETRTDLQKMAMDIKKIEDAEERGIATQRMMEAIGRAKGSTAGEKIAAIWKSGLLTSPLTTAGNIAGNVQEAAVRKTLVDPIASIADKVMSAATGKRTKTYTLKGLGLGTREGLTKGVTYFKTGYDPRRDPAAKWDAKNVYFSDSPLGRAAEKYTKGVMRLMGAVDQPPYYGALRNSLEDQALAAAKTQRLRGPEKSDFIKKFVTEPTVEAMKRADEDALFATFQNKTRLGSVAGRAKSAAGPGGEVVMPFTQVPSSIATRVITRTPIGTAREVVRQVQNIRKGGEFDQRAMAQAIGEGGAGVALIGAGGALMKAGDINLGYPKDQKERELWEQEGRQQYSIKIGDKWHSLNYIQPFGAIMAMGAAYERSKKEGADNASAIIQGAAEAGRAMVEQSFLKGLSGGIKALNEPEREAESFIKNLSNSVMPNIVDAFARAFDEDQRVVEGALDAFKSTIPGLRETLPTKTDVTGEPMKNTAGLGALINPLRSSDAKSNPLTKELRTLQDLKLGVMPTEATKKSFKIRDLTSGEVRDLTNSSAKRTSDIWNRLIKGDEYEALTPEQKNKALGKARDDVWAVEKYRFGKEHGLNDDKSWRNLSRAQRKLYRSGAYQDYIEKAKD